MTTQPQELKNQQAPQPQDNLTISPIIKADYAQWFDLWQRYLTFYQTTLSEDTNLDAWEKLHDVSVPIYGFGAYKNGELIGFTHVLLHRNTWNMTACCYLEDLYVSSEARGQGAGRALIEYVYDFAAKKECNRVYWTTQEDNHTARKLYDSLAKKTDMVQYRYDL